MSRLRVLYGAYLTRLMSSPPKVLWGKVSASGLLAGTLQVWDTAFALFFQQEWMLVTARDLVGDTCQARQIPRVSTAAFCWRRYDAMSIERKRPALICILAVGLTRVCAFVGARQPSLTVYAGDENIDQTGISVFAQRSLKSFKIGAPDHQLCTVVP